MVFVGQSSLAWPIHGLSVSPLCRAVTRATGTSTAGRVKSWLGGGEGLWEAEPVFSTPVWNNGAAEVPRILEQLRRVWWDSPGLCKLPSAPKMCRRSSCGIGDTPVMGSRFTKGPACCDVPGEAFLGHRIPPGHYIQPMEPCPCSALGQGRMSSSHLWPGC